MALTRNQIDDFAEEGVFLGNIYEIAQAIEAEVRKQDETLIRQLVAALEGYRRNYNYRQPCDAERAGRAWLEGKT